MGGLDFVVGAGLRVAGHSYKCGWNYSAERWMIPLVSWGVFRLGYWRLPASV